MTGKTYDHAALKSLIDSDAANAAKSDADVLAWLKATVTVYDRAALGDLVRILADSGVWAEMATAAAASDPTVAPIFAELQALTNQPQLQTIDVRHARMAAAMTALVASAAVPSMTVGVKADIEALSPGRSVVRHVDAGFSKCVLGDVVAARAA